MAKKQQAAEETTALAVKQETGLAAVPQDVLEYRGAGTENITSDDVTLPRLGVAQSNTPQRKRGDSKYIQGLDEGFLFNNVTEEVYGEGPLKFVVLQFLGARFVEFNPMDEGGGVKDFNVPKGDPRTQFHDVTKDGVTKREKPVATEFYDYVVFLPDTQEVLTLSMKSTQLKVGKKLNSLIKMPLKIGGRLVPNPPAFARLFSLSTALQQDGQYSWFNFVLKPLGATDDETRAIAASLYETYKAKKVNLEEATEGEVVDRGDDPDAY